MRILVCSNCQRNGIAEAVRAFHPGAEVAVVGVHELVTPAARAALAERLTGFDAALMSSDVLAGPLDPARLKTPVARIPRVRFAGFHPDMVFTAETARGKQRFISATDLYHSRIAIAAYLAGLSPAEAAALYNTLVFSRLGYARHFPVQQELLIESFTRLGYDVLPFLRLWLRDGCFMYTINHPHPRVLRDVALLACERLGIAPARMEIPDTALTDHLAHGPRHPVFPAIARAIGVPPRDDFAAPGEPGGLPTPMSAEEYCARSFRLYLRYPRDVLSATEGVAEAMASLGLVDARRPAGRAPLLRHALLTYHGTVVRRLPGGDLLTAPLTDTQGPGEDLLLSLPAAGLARATQAPEWPDVTLEPAARRFTLRAHRGPHYLCAEGQSAAIGFTRTTAEIWESFLPLPLPRLDLLRRLTTGAWVLAGEEAPLPAGDIRLLPGFVLEVGDLRLDLARPTFPVEPAGPRALRVLTPDGPRTLREAGAASRDGPLALGEELTLLGDAEATHLPLATSLATRRWCFSGATAPGPGLARRAARFMRGRLDLPGVGGGSATLLLSRPLILAHAPAVLGDPVLEAALRLHVLERFAVPEARLLVPPGADPGLLRALGFSQPLEPMPQAAASAEDVLRLTDPAIGALPAAALISFQARAAARAPAGAAGLRLLLAGEDTALPNEAIQALRARGFSRLDPAAITVAERLAALTRAAFLVAETGPALANLLLLPPGAAVIELAGETPAPAWWEAASRLGLRHAICPGGARAELPALLTILDAFG